MEHLRCPFCHDVFLKEATDRVKCVSCSATHHAECFAEHGECAATGCASVSVAIGHVEMDVKTLQGIASDREALARMAAAKPPRRLGVFASIVLALLALGGFPVAGVLFGPIGMLLWTFVAVLLMPTVGFGARNRVRVNLREPESFDAIFGVWRSGSWTPGVMPDHTEFMRERLAEAGPQDATAPLETPANCPHCKQDLEAEDGEDALAFCYHCGGDLTAAPPEPLDIDEPLTGPTREKA